MVWLVRRIKTECRGTAQQRDPEQREPLLGVVPPRAAVHAICPEVVQSFLLENKRDCEKSPTIPGCSH